MTTSARTNPGREQRWTVYAMSVLAFSVVSFLVLYGMQRLQQVLPFNPTGMPAVTDHVAFNAAVSFMTNTNWQSYGGETTMSHLTQMSGLTVQNFVSAAVGMAVMAAFIRGLARRRAKTLGNFWVDLTRTVVRVLLPLSIVVALILVSQGVIQNLSGFTRVVTVEGLRQLIPGGPAASQIAIKQLGTNGGGFFNVNSAHPFENSTAFSNFVENWAILIIPLALAFTFGHMVRDRRQGRAVFAIMLVIWAGMSLLAIGLEQNGNPELSALGVSQGATADQAGGNMKGKEVRFGPVASGLWAASTTGTSNGSVNSMHDSFTPLGGMIPLVHMLFGEVSPGGVSVGLNGLLIMVILSVFVAGLMVGRTPEYLGKKIQATEMKLVVLHIVAMPPATTRGPPGRSPRRPAWTTAPQTRNRPVTTASPHHRTRNGLPVRNLMAVRAGAHRSLPNGRGARSSLDEGRRERCGGWAWVGIAAGRRCLAMWSTSS